MNRANRKGIGRSGACSTDRATILIRGDVVSVRISKDTIVEFPPDWGLIHDPTGTCVDFCEVFIAPYRVRAVSIRGSDPVREYARNYFGDGFRFSGAEIDIPNGPWDRVGVVAQIFYNRYGELESPYQHPIDEALDAGERVLLYRQRKAQTYFGQRAKAYRLSLPDGCVINDHGFVWP